MNINKEYSDLNNVIEILTAQYKENIQAKEMDWIQKAVTDIKNSDKNIQLEDKISRQLDALDAFTPDQIVRLVNILQQAIKHESNDYQIQSQLCQKVAGLTHQKNLSLDRFILESADKNFGIKVAVQQVKQGKLDSLKAAECLLQCGVAPDGSEIQEALIQIAKLAVQQEGFRISENIKNYGIDASTARGQEALIEIAMLAAQKNGGGTSQYIKNYGIDASTPKGQQMLIEIAKLAAQQNGGGTSQYIKNYGIDASTPKGQQMLIEIAKLAAQQSGRGTSMNIKNYGIDASTLGGQEALIEIAKLAAQQSGGGTSQFIKNYGIDASTAEGIQALIDIAKLSAQQNGLGTSHMIKNYGFNVSIPKEQQALIEIAKLSAQQTVRGTIPYLHNYLIDTESVEGKKQYLELTQFLFSCVVKQSSTLKYSDIIDTFETYSKTCNGNGIETYHIDLRLFEAPLKQLKDGDFSGALKESLGTAALIFEMSAGQMEWVQHRMSSIQDKFEKDEALKDKAEKDKKVKAEQEEFLEQFMSLCTFCASRKDLKQLFKENGPLFESLFSSPPSLKIRLIQEVIVSSLDPKSLFVERLKGELSKESIVVKKIAVLPRDLREAVLEDFLRGFHNGHAKKVESLRERVSDTVHAQLSCFIMAEFAMQGSDINLVLDAIVKDRSFRDAKYQQPLLAALVAIKQTFLGDDRKIKLLKDVFAMKDANERNQSLKLITDILNFKGESYLSEINDLVGLRVTLERLFIDKCKVKVDNFGALYHDSVGTWRGKEALLTYAGKHVGNPRALPYFQLYLNAVLKKEFTQVRYAVENNPHLNQIKKSHPKVFEAWQKPASLTAAEITSEGSVKAISVEVKVVENLKQALVNRHLGLEHQERLFPIVSACIGNWNTLEASLKLIKEQLEPLSNRRLTSEEMLQRQLLQLQKYLLELIVDPSDLEKKLLVLKGIQVKGLEQALAPFYQDLKDAVQMLHSSKKSSPAENAVMDSDDPNHFLLMGTEVLNSCLNVNGSASFNVGVLGYALDGKHRLALVCDPSGKILARSVLRLLIDANGQPVLFQERVYVADASPEYPSLLRKIALKKAATLGVPLVVSPSDFEKEQAQTYAFAIEAKGKPVPFEYVDALGGLQSGAYKIGSCLQINNITPSDSA